MLNLPFLHKCWLQECHNKPICLTLFWMDCHEFYIGTQTTTPEDESCWLRWSSDFSFSVTKNAIFAFYETILTTIGWIAMELCTQATFMEQSADTCKRQAVSQNSCNRLKAVWIYVFSLNCCLSCCCPWPIFRVALLLYTYCNIVLYVFYFICIKASLQKKELTLSGLPCLK